MGALRFLSAALVLAIHDDQVRLYGGAYGVRDEAALDSALAQPRATYGGECLHPTVYDSAPAYGYHLCQNHPFVDGNKRAAGMAMFTFLKLNSLEPIASEMAYYETMMAVATGQMSKEALTAWLRTAVASRADDSDATT